MDHTRIVVARKGPFTLFRGSLLGRPFHAEGPAVGGGVAPVASFATDSDGLVFLRDLDPAHPHPRA